MQANPHVDFMATITCLTHIYPKNMKGELITFYYTLLNKKYYKHQTTNAFHRIQQFGIKVKS